MNSGAITNYIDVAQLVLYAFWIFFAGLIYYLHRENKREGYPLETDPVSNARIEGFPGIPSPKEYKLPHGGSFFAPNDKRDMREIKGEKIGPWPGAPLEPTGDPMQDCIGPGSYAERADVPDLTAEGELKIVPLRVAKDFWIEEHDPDPRGMTVVGADGKSGGKVVDVWVDRAELLIRYFEVEVEGGGHVLLPQTFSTVHGSRGEINVHAILSHHFAKVPRLKSPDQITFLEEEKVCAYYGAGTLYAEPSRSQPLI